jgi:hypothetical protein
MIAAFAATMPFASIAAVTPAALFADNMIIQRETKAPFIVKWPSEIRESSVTASTINFTDVFATFADVLKVPAEDMYLGSIRDSHSFDANAGCASFTTCDGQYPRLYSRRGLEINCFQAWRRSRGAGPEAF